MNTQAHVLSVNIGCKCNGCEKKVKRLLRKVKGVRETSIDAEQGKVTVIGDVDPDVLVKKLNKSGKHAEICGSQKGSSVFNNKNTGQFDVVNAQLKSLQMGKNDEKKEVKGEKEPQKQSAVQQVIQEMKLKDDEGDDEGFDDDDGGGEEPQEQKKVVHVMVSGEKAAAGKDKKATRGKRVMSMMGKAIGGMSEGKIGNLGKIKGGGGEGKIGKLGKIEGGGGEGKIVNKGGGGGGFPDFEVTERRTAAKLPVAEGPAEARMVSVNGGGGGPGFGVGPIPVGPYQHPQYRQGMMNGGGSMHHPGMYGPPMPPSSGYDYVPPMPPPVHSDPVTSMFSDENPESCSVM